MKKEIKKKNLPNNGCKFPKSGERYKPIHSRNSANPKEVNAKTHCKTTLWDVKLKIKFKKEQTEYDK